MTPEAIEHTPRTQPLEVSLQRLASLLSGNSIGTGELAALRRLNPKDPSTSAVALYGALWRAGLDVPADSPVLPRWAVLTQCLALVAGRHRADVPVGRALAEANISEARVKQLLEADAALLLDLLPRLARRFAEDGVAADWRALAELALSLELDAPRAEEARLRIARSYIAALRT